MIWGGLLIGLLAVKADRLPAPFAATEAGPAVSVERSADPYAESRRSREILEVQERQPARRIANGRNERRALAGGPVHVIDGDTFDHDGMRVRIADIDTPEREGQCAYETQLAAQATRRMRSLLDAGPFELHLTADGRDEDRYGRKLRIVTRDGRSLGDQLVAEGLARTWSGRREPWC